MHIDYKLYKLLKTMPSTGVFGNNSDISRYRFMIKLTDSFNGKEKFLSTYIKDKITVVLYPKIYDNSLYIMKEDAFEHIEKIEDIASRDKSEISAVFIPTNTERINCLVEFPSVCEDADVSVFYNEFRQSIFFESFPYGKESFENMVSHIILNSSFSMHKKIVLVKNDIKYGATDVSNLDDAINKAMVSMKKYTSDILYSNMKDIDYEILKVKVKIYEQYKCRKHELIKQRHYELLNDFDMEYQMAKERFLISEGTNGHGILSPSFFSEISKYNKVSGSTNIEKKIFDNYIYKVSAESKNIERFLKMIWNRFMLEISELSEKSNKEFVKEVIIKNIKDNFVIKEKIACPDNPLDYRILKDKNGYIIKLEKYIMDYFDNDLKDDLYSLMEKIMNECEEKYV